MSNITQLVFPDSLSSHGNGSLAPEIQRMWCEDLYKHTEAALKLMTSDTNNSFCLADHDGALCWPPALSGTITELPCPQMFNEQVYETGGNATRKCMDTGDWSATTNYSQCLTESALSEIDLSVVLRIIFISGYSLSFGSLCAALVILRHFRSLKCVRNTIHANLFAALLLRLIAWVLMYSYSELVTFSKTSRFDVILIISILNATASVQSFGLLAIFFWMFVEGFYLFLIVHYTYRAEKVTFRWYALIGWGIPSVLTIIRITVDAVMNPLKLWVLEGCDRYLVTIPVLSMLGLNALFLIAILYALSGKLRRSFSPTGITTTPPPSIQLRPLGYPSATARPLPGSYGRLSCPPMLALSSSEIQHHPTTNEDLANTSSTNSRGQRNSSTLVPLDLQNSMDLAGKYGERSCRPKRSASVSAGMKPRWGRVQSDVSFSLVKQQGLSLNQLGNPSRRNSSLGSRMRLRQFVGRLNAREFAKTVKAGLLLMPLLGLPEIIFITPYHPSLKPAFDLITAFLRSTQGFWVALLYCFLTQEVRQQLAIRKRVCSARSSIRPTQRWPPLLRQQSPQIRGPTAM